MCVKNAMELSLNGDTFAGLKEDFDSILAQTLGNMESKGADEAVITLKLGVSLEKQQFVRNEEPEELTKPSFKHDISSVMQVKNKKSGSLSGDYELVWDEEEQKYVMRKITNGQLTLFDEVEQYQEEETTSGPAMLEAPTEERQQTAFEWISKFVDKKMVITEAMGNYTVRTEDGSVVLTSASAEDSPLHCDAEILEKHIGHDLVCVGYGGEELYQITVECEECLETLFSLKLDAEPSDDDAEVVEAEYAEVAEAEYVEADEEVYDAEEDIENGYDYSAPEEEEE